jgi:hypothetical protein
MIILFLVFRTNVGVKAQQALYASGARREARMRRTAKTRAEMPESRHGPGPLAYCRRASRNKLKEISIYFQENPKVCLKRSVM